MRNVLLLGSLLLLPAQISLAQSAGDVETVTVTASKRETKLLDTPMSLSVVGSDALAASNADNFGDFARLVPGLTYTDAGPGNKRYALRGLQSAGEPEVALYYDEIPVSGLPGASLDTGDSQPDLKLWDVDRVEVLRGPQGTLYGNGAMGGAIRILSKRPELDRFDDALEISTSGTHGGGSSGSLNLMVNQPLVNDELAVRLAVYARYEGGWIDQVPASGIALRQLNQADINWERTLGGRASIAWQPSVQWNVTAIAYYQDMATGDAFDVYPSFALPDDRYVSKSYVRKPWRDKSAMFNLISDYDLGWADFTATGSFQRRTLDRNVDTTRYLLGQFHCTEFTWNQSCFGPPLVPADSFSLETVSAWSGETRLSSKQDGPLLWTVGAFLQNADNERLGQVAPADSGGYMRFDANGVAIGRIFARNNFDSFDQYAFFGEGSYEVLNDLTATAGLRWFHSARSDQQVLVQQFFPGQPVGPEPFQQFDQSALFKKFELSYKIDGAGLVYAQAAQGFRAGGPNYPGGFNLTAPSYGADSVWDYETGWKFDFAKTGLYWSGAVFDIEWSNMQQLVPQALFSYIANGGQARSQGFETELEYRPLGGLTLSGGITYNDARLVGQQPLSSDPSVQLVAGDKLANVPDWALNGSISYSWLLDGFNLGARLGGAYQSARRSLATPQNPAYFIIEAYSLFGLHLSMDRGSGWQIGLDVDNLFDSFSELSGRSEDSNLINTVTPARPRTVSLRLRLAP